MQSTTVSLIGTTERERQSTETAATVIVVLSILQGLLPVDVQAMRRKYPIPTTKVVNAKVVNAFLKSRERLFQNDKS